MSQVQTVCHKVEVQSNKMTAHSGGSIKTKWGSINILKLKKPLQNLERIFINQLPTPSKYPANQS